MTIKLAFIFVGNAYASQRKFELYPERIQMAKEQIRIKKEQQKQQVIALLLSTPEGRARLAASMQQPIRRRNDVKDES